MGLGFFSEDGGVDMGLGSFSKGGGYGGGIRRFLLRENSRQVNLAK